MALEEDYSNSRSLISNCDLIEIFDDLAADAGGKTNYLRNHDDATVLCVTKNKLSEANKTYSLISGIMRFAKLFLSVISERI